MPPAPISFSTLIPSIDSLISSGAGGWKGLGIRDRRWIDDYAVSVFKIPIQTQTPKRFGAKGASMAIVFDRFALTHSESSIT